MGFKELKDILDFLEVYERWSKQHTNIRLWSVRILMKNEPQVEFHVMVSSEEVPI